MNPLQTVLQSIDANAQTTQYLSDQSNTNYQNIIDAVLGIADKIPNTVDLVSAEAQMVGELEAQNKKTALYNSIGKEGFSQFANQLTTQLTTAITERNALAKKIQEKESVGFFDNPLEFIFNQMELDDDYANLKGIETSANSAALGLQQLNASMQSTAATEREYAVTKNEAAIQSKLNAMRAEVEIKAASATIDSLKSNAQRIDALMKADAHVMQDMVVRYNILDREEQLKLARQNAEEMDEEKQLRIQERQLRLDQFKQLQISRESQAKLIQNAMILSGVDPQVAMREVSAASVESLLKQPGAIGKRYQLYLEMGAAKELEGSLAYGSTATEAFGNIDFLGIPLKTEAQKQMRAIVDQVSTSPALAMFTDKKEKALQKEKLTQQEVGKYRELIKSGDASNPYAAPAFSVIADQTTVKESPWFTEAIAPSQVNSTDPKLLVEHTLAALKAKKISLEQAAAGVTAFYTTAVDYNNEHNNYKAFGFEPQVAYKTLLPSPQSFMSLGGIAHVGPILSKAVSGDVKINLTNPLEVKKYLLLRSVVDKGILGITDPAISGNLFGVGDAAVTPISKVK